MSELRPRVVYAPAEGPLLQAKHLDTLDTVIDTSIGYENWGAGINAYLGMCPNPLLPCHHETLPHPYANLSWTNTQSSVCLSVHPIGTGAGRGGLLGGLLLPPEGGQKGITY